MANCWVSCFFNNSGIRHWVLLQWTMIYIIISDESLCVTLLIAQSTLSHDHISCRADCRLKPHYAFFCKNGLLLNWTPCKDTCSWWSMAAASILINRIVDFPEKKSSSIIDQPWYRLQGGFIQEKASSTEHVHPGCDTELCNLLQKGVPLSCWKSESARRSLVSISLLFSISWMSLWATCSIAVHESNACFNCLTD